MNSKFSIRILCSFLLLSLFVSLKANQVDTIQVYSAKMDKKVKNVLVLPDNYSPDSAKKYPVVYLLHGHGGNHATWTKNVKHNLPELATKHQMIFVCPDGQNSWYWDSPINAELQYDTYVSRELIPYIDSLYNTIPNSSGRAITGLSMGGHGALWLTIQHPDLFGAAGSMSGGVDIRPFPENWNMAKSLGKYDDNIEQWGKYTVIENIDVLKNSGTSLIIDCGQDDFFIGVNEALHAKMLDLKILHTYKTSPGVHNAPYWANSIDEHLDFFNKFFLKNN